MAKRGDKPSKRAERPRGGASSRPSTDVIVDADGTVTPVSGRTAKELHKLEKKLAAARKTEAKRLRQLQAAEATKGRKQVAKRTRQATDAAKEVVVAGGEAAERGSRGRRIGGGHGRPHRR